MRVCIVGAGAVGGVLGVRLAQAGHDVGALARGATLQALRQHGWWLRESGAETAVTVRASDDAEALGRHDLVVVSVKGPALGAVAPDVARLVAPGGIVLSAMNGVPWWFFAGRDAGDPLARPLESVDPGGAVAACVPLSQVIGGVVHWSSGCPQPGVVQHVAGRGLLIGEPLGGRSDRVEALADAMRRAGFEAEAVPDIRRDVWYKLWGNMTANPASALTGATMDRVLADPLVVRFMLDCMREAAAVGAAIGCHIDESGEARLDLARKLGAFKTSMLQDAEAGRPIEVDALVTAVHEIARRVAVPTPSIDALLGLTRLRFCAPSAAGRAA